LVNTRVTHEDLRKRAVEWLTKRLGCGAVLSEMGCMYTRETPDAIGWQVNDSVLVECKVSRADFHAQKKKFFMVDPDKGMGRVRYFLVPSKLITLADMEDLPGWGLLYASEHQIRIVKHPVPRKKYDQESEMTMLVSAIRRVKTKEFLTIVPMDQLNLLTEQEREGETEDLTCLP
jgi:hypothetical protein